VTDKLAYTVKEAARAMSVSRATMYSRINDGTVPVYQFGGRTLILRSDLEAVLRNGPPGLHLTLRRGPGTPSHSTIPRPGSPPNRP
jgi:excisionase family DNA binding protein